MDKIRLFLILFTLTTTLGPVLGVMILYRNNLLGLIAPPAVAELVSGTFVKEGSLEPPNLVSSDYDVKSRTVTLTFNFTNPFNFDLTLKSMSANVECDVHRVPLGVAVLKTPVDVLASETSLITVLCTWTQDAISHFQSSHTGAESIDVDLVGLTIDTSGINIQMKERINIPNVPIL